MLTVCYFIVVVNTVVVFDIFDVNIVALCLFKLIDCPHSVL